MRSRSDRRAAIFEFAPNDTVVMSDPFLGGRLRSAVFDNFRRSVGEFGAPGHVTHHSWPNRCRILLSSGGRLAVACSNPPIEKAPLRFVSREPAGDTEVLPRDFGPHATQLQLADRGRVERVPRQSILLSNCAKGVEAARRRLVLRD